MAISLRFRGWPHQARAAGLRLHRRADPARCAPRQTGHLSAGQLAVALDRVDQARACAAELLAYCKVHPNTRTEHHAFHYQREPQTLAIQLEALGEVLLDQRTVGQVLDDHVEIGFEVQGVAMSFAGVGEADRAIRLVGGVAADWVRVGANVSVRFWAALMDRHIGAARAQLGARAEQVWSQGFQLSFDEVIKLTLS